jgi:non-heme chloroperoxidase
MDPTASSVLLSTGVTLPYVEQGDRSGVPVLLLHGPTDSWQSFKPLLAHLPAWVHAFAPTQRGHGDADRPASGYRPEDFAADAVAFMDAIGLEAAVLVGHSGSTYTAQRCAIDHPHRVLGLVLIGAPYGLRDKPGAPALLRTIAELRDPLDREFVREFVESTVTQPVPPAFLEACVDECLKVPAGVWKATLEGLFESPVPTATGAISVPTLILWGDRDEICPWADQQALVEAIAGARLLTYQGTGHSPHFEQPERAAADLAAYVLPAHRPAGTATSRPGS